MILQALKKIGNLTTPDFWSDVICVGDGIAA